MSPVPPEHRRQIIVMFASGASFVIALLLIALLLR